MSLGANDALGVSSNKGSIYPSRIRVSQPAAATNSTSGMLAFTLLVENKANGQFEWVRDTVQGDRFVVKQAGLFALGATVLSTSVSAQSALTKNVPSTANSQSPSQLASATGLAPLSVLSIKTIAATNSNIPLAAVTWLDAGDYVQVSATGTISTSDDTQYFIMEKIYG